MTRSIATHETIALPGFEPLEYGSVGYKYALVRILVHWSAPIELGDDYTSLLRLLKEVFYATSCLTALGLRLEFIAILSGEMEHTRPMSFSNLTPNFVNDVYTW